MNLFFMSRILTNISGLQSFFASVKVLLFGYLLQAPSFFLRPKPGQIRSKLPFPATTPPVSQSGTQGQTGRYWMPFFSYLRNQQKYLLFQFFLNVFLEIYYPLDTFLQQSLYTTSGFADFGEQVVFIYGYVSIFSFTS